MVLGAPGKAHMAKLESAGPDFKNHAQICEGWSHSRAPGVRLSSISKAARARGLLI